MSNNDIDRTLYNLEEDEPLYSLEDPVSGVPVPDGELDEDETVDEDYGSDGEESGIEGETDGEDAPAVVSNPSPVKILFSTLIGPVEGWKALKRTRFKTEEFAARCFYPLVAAAALAEGVMFFYEANMTFSDWVLEAISTFVAFFFGYFTILLLGSFILPRKSREILKKDIGRQFVMLSLSSLALFWMLVTLLPMFEPVLVFLPLWTIYIVFKGVRLLRVPADVTSSTAGLLCMLVIGVPVLWKWLMEELLAVGV